jgi:hypothetical protein
MPQETTPAASPAAPTAVIPGARSSVNLGPDYDQGVLVWRGPDFHLYVSDHGRPIVQLTDITSGAPSVTVLNGRAYIAFTNNGNNALHLGWFNGSSQLQGGEIIRLGGVVQTAETGPALAADPANNILYLAWAGTDRTHRLNFTQSFDGGRTWPAGPVTTAEIVAWAPTLAVRDSQVYVGWTGTDPDNTPNVAKYALGRELDTASLPFGGVLRGEQAPGGTRIATDGTTLYAAFSTNTQQRWVQCDDAEAYPADRTIFSEDPDIRSYAPPDLNLDTPAKPRVLWTGTDGRVNDQAVAAV